MPVFLPPDVIITASLVKFTTSASIVIFPPEKQEAPAAGTHPAGGGVVQKMRVPSQAGPFPVKCARHRE